MKNVTGVDPSFYKREINLCVLMKTVDLSRMRQRQKPDKLLGKSENCAQLVLNGDELYQKYIENAQMV